MHNAQTGANFDAIDRVVKIVRELDRYHGFATREREPAEDRRRLPSPASPLALAAPSLGLDVTPEIAAASDEGGAAAHVIPAQAGI